MNFFGLSLAELVSVTVLLTFVFGILSWLINRAYHALKENIIKPVLATMEDLKDAIDVLSKNVDLETKWIHERHSEVVKWLNIQDKQLDEHDDKLTAHAERIKTLFRDQERK